MILCTCVCYKILNSKKFSIKKTKKRTDHNPESRKKNHILQKMLHTPKRNKYTKHKLCAVRNEFCT